MSAAAAARCVLRNAEPASWLAASAEPALKPNQPNHRMPAPRTVSGRLCGWMLVRAVAPCACRARARQPSAAAADEMWTTVPPAKSSAPSLYSQPPAPHPVGERAVDEDRPQHREHHVRLELHALGDRAGDQPDRDDREHALVHRVHRCAGSSAPAVRSWSRHPVEAEVGEAADERREYPAAVAEGERVAEERPDDRHRAHREEALHGRGEHVLAADHAAVERRETRRHEQDHGRRSEHPCGIAGVETLHRPLPSPWS